ncbi:hypothetical protein [Fusobacterium polymorphum]|uniref:hypothetical protein n=1 Tax=Fusobacterium nucleatum subsp. polymorphum TaxID=76857 RepID=UPI00300BEEBA
MYIIEKLYYSVYFNNSEKEEKEFKFINDLNYLLNISDVTIKNKKITPRLIKNFIEETIELFKNKSLSKKLEKRILIAYIFLKNFFYEEFYEKLNNKDSFYALFPIEIEFQDGIILNLDEIDLIKNLINKKNRILSKLRRDCVINNRVFYFYKRQDDYKYTLDNYLAKLKYLSSGENLEEKLQKLEELFKSLKIINISEKSKINIFICSLFNIYLYSYEKKVHFVNERIDKIEKAIRKFKFLGNKEQFSQYQKFYEDFSPEISNKDFSQIFYQKFIKSKKYEIFNKRGYFMVLAMESLDIYGTKEEQKKFLNLILEMNNGNIKDDYLQAFFLTDLDDIKISDNIVRKILKGDYKIDRESTIRLICKNIERILKRFSSSEYRDSINLKDFLEHQKNSLTNYKTELYSSEILSNKEVNSILENYIKFIEKIKEILSSKDLIKEENDVSISFKDIELEATEEVKEIKNLKINEEKIKKLTEFLINGKIQFRELSGIYCDIKNNRI